MMSVQLPPSTYTSCHHRGYWSLSTNYLRQILKSLSSGINILKRWWNLTILLYPVPFRRKFQYVCASHTMTAAISKMKDSKAVGAGYIPNEFWKICVPAGTIFLTGLIYPLPQARSTNVTVVIQKGKRDIADCSKYKPIRLVRHTLKIVQRISDQRLRGNHRWPVRICEKTIDPDAIHPLLCPLAEKHKSVHAAILDPEKSFDRVR